ncbi:MAG: FmdB family zinc ribbon protein [Gaiellaceae bacterium]
MPIYEYRCPDGHTFELFQRMTDAPPAACQICGAAPLSKVLYPAAIHFKGSGFYSTDYGRSKGRRDASKDGAAPSEGDGETKSKDPGETKSNGPEKKAAAEG